MGKETRFAAHRIKHTLWRSGHGGGGDGSGVYTTATAGLFHLHSSFIISI